MRVCVCVCVGVCVCVCRELQGVQERLGDLETVIRSTGEYRKNKLRGIAGSILLWEAHVMREKASHAQKSAYRRPLLPLS